MNGKTFAIMAAVAVVAYIMMIGAMFIPDWKCERNGGVVVRKGLTSAECVKQGKVKP